jgi:hypothetical protein
MYSMVNVNLLPPEEYKLKWDINILPAKSLSAHISYRRIRHSCIVFLFYLQLLT